MTLLIRRVRAEDWPATRGARLESLQDPAAPMAFLETYETALARADEFWQGRTSAAASGPVNAQFLAIDAEGDAVAAVTGLREEAGSADFFGVVVRELQVHVVGVWVRPAHRGTGLLGRLVDEVVAWAVESGVDRLRLLVHEQNRRAQAAYRGLGFSKTGAVVVLAEGREIEMVRRLHP